MRRLSILSLDVADVVYEELERDIADAIRERKRFVIMYASMHILNLASNDANLRAALSNADVLHPDGTGVWSAAKFLHGTGFRGRFNWTDHAGEFIGKCSEKGWKIFFLGSTTQILQQAMEKMKREYPSIKIAGMKNGFDDLESPGLVAAINSANADILWVAMGSPKQEIWIQEHKNELNCPVIQAVGDAVSLIAGVKRRGPKFLQRLGLEWFVRLLFDPKKFFNRYVVGIPLFATRIVRQKLRKSRSQTEFGNAM